MNREKIKQIITETRQEAGLSQSEFAADLSKGIPTKITKQTISKWENGRTIPDLLLMVLIKNLNPRWKSMTERIMQQMVKEDHESLQRKVDD